MKLGLFIVALVCATSAFGCSAIVQPDTTRLGGDHDTGPILGNDTGPILGNDTGPILGNDTGPIPGDAGLDAGPILGDAGADAGNDAAASCTGGPSCSGGVATSCEAGVLVSQPCPLGCAPVEPRCALFDPSNVSADLFAGTPPDVSVETSVDLDTTVCPGLGSNHVTTQGDGSEVCVEVVHDLRVNAGGTIRVVGSRPLVLLATGMVRIDGRIDVSAVRLVPGPGGGRGARPGMLATGPSTGFSGLESGYSDGGGGGGGFGGGGGDGGDGGSTTGGFGGFSGGADDLIPLTGGSGGGVGPGSESTLRMGNSGLGGAGGGALQISSLVSIRVDGVILAGGGGGGGGGNDSTVGSGNFGAGGGGGSGGAILLEAPMLDVRGVLSTTGGGGGGAASTGGGGGAGTDGRDVTPGAAGGGASGGTRYGAAGGDSGADASADASDGESNLQSSANGGGGGGGVGRIVLRDAAGTYTPDPGATLSPSATGLTILPILTR